jgi:isoquinoline 1-oxidoreductase alpha subunit
MIHFRLNGEEVGVDVPAEMPLLWVLRDTLSRTGTKYGCGEGVCGACTVHIEGAAVRSCLVPVAAVEGRSVTTIEGLATGDSLHAVQQAWIDEQVPQCGYCQPGMIMAVAAFLQRNPQPDDAAINANITNVCRCGTYPRIRRAIHRAAQLRSASGSTPEKAPP